MATDARIRFTKRSIRESFFSLIKKKNISNITVKELCDMAEINRATFYRYYSDVYDLLDKIEDEMVDLLQESMSRGSIFGPEAGMLFPLQQFKSNEDLITLLTNPHINSRLMEKLNRLSAAKYDISFGKRVPALSETQAHWLYTYVALGGSMMIEEWIQGGMKESPEELAQFTGELIEVMINHYQNKKV